MCQFQQFVTSLTQTDVDVITGSVLYVSFIFAIALVTVNSLWNLVFEFSKTLVSELLSKKEVNSKDTKS